MVEDGGSAWAGENRPFAWGENFFLGGARNPLKSRESDEGIQGNPNLFPRETKKIQGRCPGFPSCGLVRLGAIWPQARPAIASARAKGEDGGGRGGAHFASYPFEKARFGKGNARK